MLNRPKTLAITIALTLTTAAAAFGGVTPTQIARFLPEGVVPEDEFARSLDLDGDIAVVGAPLDDDLGEDAGAVYVFRNIDGQWTQEAKLLASNGDEGDEFGASVAVSGNRIVVLAERTFNDMAGIGSFYTFDWDGSAWVETNVSQPGGPELSRLIGSSLALDGDILAVSIFLSPGAQSSAIL